MIKKVRLPEPKNPNIVDLNELSRTNDWTRIVINFWKVLFFVKYDENFYSLDIANIPDWDFELGKLGNGEKELIKLSTKITQMNSPSWHQLMANVIETIHKCPAANNYPPEILYIEMLKNSQI